MQETADDGSPAPASTRVSLPRGDAGAHFQCVISSTAAPTTTLFHAGRWDRTRRVPVHRRRARRRRAEEHFHHAVAAASPFTMNGQSASAQRPRRREQHVRPHARAGQPRAPPTTPPRRSSWMKMLRAHLRKLPRPAPRVPRAAAARDGRERQPLRADQPLHVHRARSTVARRWTRASKWSALPRLNAGEVIAILRADGRNRARERGAPRPHDPGPRRRPRCLCPRARRGDRFDRRPRRRSDERADRAPHRRRRGGELVFHRYELRLPGRAATARSRRSSRSSRKKNR